MHETQQYISSTEDTIFPGILTHWRSKHCPGSDGSAESLEYMVWLTLKILLRQSLLHIGLTLYGSVEF